MEDFPKLRDLIIPFYILLFVQISVIHERSRGKTWLLIGLTCLVPGAFRGWLHDKKMLGSNLNTLVPDTYRILSTLSVSQGTAWFLSQRERLHLHSLQQIHWRALKSRITIYIGLHENSGPPTVKSSCPTISLCTIEQHSTRPPRLDTNEAEAELS